MLDGAAMARRYGLGAFVQLKVTGQDGRGAAGGRVRQVQVIGSTGTRTLTRAGFQAAFGLRSDWFFPVLQPRQQVTSLRYVKTRFAPEVYRQFGCNGWQDHAWVTAEDYRSVGRPAYSVIAAANVKYPWSPTQYVVTRWASESMDSTFTLSWTAWKAAGFPPPARAGTVDGTMFYRNGSDAAIYAQAPDDSVHHLTPAEWAAAGHPHPVIR